MDFTFVIENLMIILNGNQASLIKLVQNLKQAIALCLGQRSDKLVDILSWRQLHKVNPAILRI